LALAFTAAAEAVGYSLFQSESLIVLAEQGVGFDNIDLRGGEEWGTKAALRERG